MKKVLYGFCLMLWVVFASAQIKVEVDETELKLGESVRLILSTDANLKIIPDITPLHKDFMILSTERASSYSNLNGHTNLSLRWIIQLQPKHSGKIIIPSLTIGQEKTAPIEILVNVAKEEKSTLPNEDVMLIASVDKSSPHVNEEVNYTIKLYTQKPLVDVTYQGPELKDGLVIALGDTRNYQVTRNGQVYSVEEQHYVLFPQKSGPLFLKSPQLAATLYDGFAQKIKIKANPVDLTVQPIPTFAQNMPWIPATNVTLHQEYEGSPKEVKQGETLSRKITLEAKGLPGQLLPNLPFLQEEGVSVYPESPQIENSMSNYQLVGKSTIRVTYLFNKAGQVIIPALSLKWFNTQTEKMETAILPPLSLTVAPTLPPSPANITPTPPVNPSVTAPTSGQEKSSLAWIVAGLFALVWVLTLFCWWLSPSCFKHWRRKRCLWNLKRACLHHNPLEAKNALICWGQQTWPQQSIVSLNDVALLSHNPDLKQEILNLSQVLYSGKPNQWQGTHLWQLISAYQRKKVKKETSSLPPLHFL